MQNYETDVLVVGGGAAGMMAAYEAGKQGARVLLALKGAAERCGSTVMAPGAIAGSGSWCEAGDSPDLHFADTVKGGAYLNEQSLVRKLAESAPALILELESIGALWQRDEGGDNYLLRVDGGHSYPRCPYLEDRTGREMLRALHGELRRRNVTLREHIIITRLLTESGKVVGAAGIDLSNSESVLIRAKAVVLACGGAGMLYQNTSNPADLTGDGYALALQAGAQLMDMEFVQFYPLAFLFPASLRGALAGLLYYVHLRNKDGQRFMEKYDPERMELSTRDLIARAICQEVKEGRGGPRGGVYIDMTYQEPGFIRRMQPALAETYAKQGVDPEKDWLEVAPSCHFFMGGVRVDADWASSLPGLFVAGETGAGLHGANRLSQNALAELLVSGHFSGANAAAYAAANAMASIDPSAAVQDSAGLLEAMLERDQGIRPLQWRAQLQQLMWEEAGVYRSRVGLEKALRELQRLKEQLPLQMAVNKSRRFNLELRQGLENRFLLQTAECVVNAALQRQESRGAHFREDFPQQDDQGWLQHLVLNLTAAGLQISKQPVDLKEIRPDQNGGGQ